MIKIKVVEVKEMTTKEGRKFKVYKTVDKTGKKMDLKFRQSVTPLPTEPCILLINDPKNVNVDTTKQYPCVWVRGLDGIEELEHKSNVSEFFEVTDDQTGDWE